MNLRELTPWLIPPLALLASALPHYNPAVSVASAPAALAATKPAPGTSRTEGVSTEGSSEQGHLDCYEHDARHLLWDFANANQLSSRENAELRLTLTGTGGAGQVSVDEDLKSDKAAPSRCPDNASDARLQRALRYFSVRFLIATLPDPGASNLQYDFDSGLEAMESAIAQSGYSIDRFDFPWNATAAPTSSTLAGTAKRNPASEPGLILFRKGDELLLLFIAGETPTSGIQKLAFTSALEQSAELSSFLRAARQNCIDNRDACPPAGVGLMTPFFTGSINSLTLALRSFRDWALDRTSDTGSSLPPLHVQIATGDATGIDLRNFDKDPFSNDSDSKPTTIVFDDPTFSATLGYNQEIRSAFLRFLHGTLNAGPREVAVLREANTGYGSSLAKMENVTLGDFVMFLIGQAHQNVSGAEGLLVKIQERMDRLSKGEPSRLEEILYGNFNDLQMEGDPEFVKFRDEYLDSFSFVDLPFPLHISAIRNASQPAVSSTPLAALLENPKTVFSVLTPQSQGTDVIPSFAEELDKPEAELVMSNLLSTLTSEKIHYVGIAATDVQDTIYLAREVHQNCPDVTVFAFTGNLLFLNSDVSEDLRGMLVVSTYPLVTLNQNLSYPWNGDSAHHQFSSDMTEGVFNATLALLGRGDQMLDYHPPFAPPLDTFDLGQPPVWIEAIGNNALIPIEIQPITPGLSTTYFYGSPNSVDAEGPEMPIVIPLDLSWAATLLFWATTLGCAAFAVSSFLPATSKRRGATWRPDLGHLNNPHAISLLVFTLSVVVFYLIVAGLFLKPWRAACIDCFPMIVFDLPRVLGGLPPLSVLASYATLILLFGSITTPLVPRTASRAVRAVRFVVHIVVAPFFYLRRLFSRPLTSASPDSDHRAEEGPTSAATTAAVAPPDSPAGLAKTDALAATPSSSWRTQLRSIATIAVGLAVSSLVLFYILLPFCFPRTSPDDYGPAAKRFFSALRYASPGDGYSPFLPLFFSSLAIVAWAASYVRRMGFLQATIPVVSAPPGDAASATSYLGLDSNSLHDVVYRETRVRRALSNPFSMPLARLLLLLFVFAGLGYCFFRYESDTAGFGLFRTVEGRTFDYLFMLLFLIGYCVTALNFLRFVGGWIELRRLLRRLSWHPLRESCAELGAPAGGSSTGEAESDHRVRNLPSLSLGSPVPTFTALEYSVELAGVVARNTQTLTTTKVSSETAPSLIKIVRDKAPELEAGLRNAKAELAEGLEADADGDSLGKRSARLSIQSALADMSHNLAAALDSDWQPAADTPREGGESVEDRWRRSAGLFLASRVLNYSALVLSHLRNLLAFSIIGFLLMLMAGSSYPFPRSDTILRFGWMMLLAAVVTAISIFFQMNRDRTLSLLSGGTPGKIDWNGAFVGHLALYGVLPIVTILGIRFPATFSGVINAVASLLPGAGHP